MLISLFGEVGFPLLTIDLGHLHLTFGQARVGGAKVAGQIQCLASQPFRIVQRAGPPCALRLIHQHLPLKRLPQRLRLVGPIHVVEQGGVIIQDGFHHGIPGFELVLRDGESPLEQGGGPIGFALGSQCGRQSSQWLRQVRTVLAEGFLHNRHRPAVERLRLVQLAPTAVILRKAIKRHGKVYLRLGVGV